METVSNGRRRHARRPLSAQQDPPTLLDLPRPAGPQRPMEPHQALEVWKRPPASPDKLLQRLRRRLAGDVARRARAAAGVVDPQAAVVAADAICRKDFVLMGRRIRWPGNELDWQWDPDSPHRWPMVASQEINVRHCRGPRNPRRTWELNRHQFWPTLGRAYALDGDGLFAEEWAHQLAGWEQMNPPGVGVNWVSPREMALRMINWLLSAEMMIGCSRIEPITAVTWTSRMVDQARRVLDELLARRGETSTEDRLALSAALTVTGLALPGLKEANTWRREGLSALTRLAEQTLAGDGAPLNESAGSCRYALQLLSLVIGRARASDLSLDPAVEQLAGVLSDLLAWLIAPDGMAPACGDHDGSIAYWLSDRDRRDVRPVLSTAAVLLQRGDLKAVAGQLDGEAVWLLGPEAVEMWNRLPAVPMPAGQRAFPSAGYFVHRGSRTSVLVRNPSLALRPCGDNLSLSLRRDGRELITEAGPFGWSDPPGWQAYFRSAASKNTLRIDGQSPRGQGRRKGCGPRCRTNFFSHRGPLLLDGEHAGFANLGASHRRIALELDERTWLVIDRLAGSAEHEVELRWQLDPRLEARSVEGGVVLATEPGGAELAFAAAATGSLDVEVLQGRPDPPAGWVRATYGGADPAAQAVYRMRSVLPGLIVSAISLDAEPARVENLAVRGRRLRCQLTRQKSMTIVTYEAQRPSLVRPGEDAILGRIVHSDGPAKLITGQPA